MTQRIIGLLLAAALLPLPTLAGPATASAPSTQEQRVEVTPLAQAHAHNDYEHRRPLLDALDHGFTSVEADVWLVEGELLVAHDRDEVEPGRTLESLYLEPLARIAAANGGTVHPGWGGTFQLLIDVKSAARPTYEAVHAALAAHEELVTRYQHGRVKQRAVDAVISGNRDLALMQSQRKRFAGYDGRLGDLGSGLAPDVMPLVSDNWTRHFTWQGVGPMPATERARLQTIVDEAHRSGHRVRFWATPDVDLPNRKAVWEVLREVGVDHINTDDLAGLQAFLSAENPRATAAGPGQEKPSARSFAVIGDVPYGAAQVAAFPGWVDRINAEPGLDLAFHVGDIKNGSSPCTDEYNAMIREQLDRFRMPLLYTPGDNEWTDCHRPLAGAYHPLERLDALRATFHVTPGRTLGADPLEVESQADLGFPENQSLRIRGIEMATLHVVGSNNGRAPWTGLGLTEPTPEQLAEESRRMQAAIELVRSTFARARQTNARAVALFQQADMFDPSYQPTWAVDAFRPLVQALVDEASTFAGEVYLFDGDSHVHHVDRPLAPGSRWLAIYGAEGAAGNLTRVTVDGEANNTSFLRVTVGRPGAPRVLSWERVAYASRP